MAVDIAGQGGLDMAECAFNSNGVCTVGMLNVFGCPKDCPKRVDASNVDQDLEVTNDDRAIINVCRKIRKFAIMRRVDIDESQHRVSDNLHLKKYIELSGKTFKEFIYGYLANIQPFQLIFNHAQSYDKAVRCLIDLSYSTALYMKLEFLPSNVLLISFHENQLKNTVKYETITNSLNYAITKTDVPAGGYRILPIKMPHGLELFDLELVCQVVEQDLVRIAISDVESAYVRYLNQKVSALTERGQVFHSMKEASYGETVLNDVSVLVDGICFTRTSVETKRALVETLGNELREIAQLPDAGSYLQAIQERYSNKAGNAATKQRAVLGLDMAECAFDLSVLRDFSKPHICGYDVVEALERLHVTNLMTEDEEHFHEFCSELCEDYNEHRANFLAYTREGMNARAVWELRKSAILWDFMEGDKDPWFFLGHEAGKSAQEIKEYRSSILIQKFMDYEDHDWQYFWVLETAYSRDFAYEYFDMEMAFADRDEFKPDDLGDPHMDLAWRLVPVPDYEMKCRQGRPEWMGIPDREPIIFRHKFIKFYDEENE